MTNSKKTKRALLSSVISLIICLSMLVGTTFAWFTDSVSSGVNKIVAGNLDIELEYLVNGAWVAVDANTNVFGDSLWEPGHTEVVTMKVSNVGTLALKYQMGINVAKEISSINVNGEEFSLSDYIEFGVVDGQFADRAAARAAVTNGTALCDGYADAQGLLPGASKEFTMVVYMPETVGNEANYRTGEVAPEIDLGINLMATQMMHEDDTFGNDYDAEAKFDAIPGATFREMAVMPSDVRFTTTANLKPDGTGEIVELDTAYEFIATQDANEANEMEIALWNADFVISFDKSVADNSVALAGQYDAWSTEWVAFANDGMPLAAGDEVRLLGDTLGYYVNYAELCSLVNVFQCGAADLTGKNAGTTMTVELRLYETAKDSTGSTYETGEYIVAGSYSYTFQNDASVPVVAPEQVVVENETIDIMDLNNPGSWNSGVPQTMTLDAAYKFVAPDDVNSVQTSPYKDWVADWYVSIEDVVADGLYLAGNYGTYGWVGFEVPAGQSYDQVGLLDTMGHAWTYEDVATLVGTFVCGVSDALGNNAGNKITVELRLTNPADASDYFVVNRIEMGL